MPAFDAYRRTRYWPALDGLRALAIVPVVWHHVGGDRGGLWSRGPLGVELFFAISGYLITSLLLRERAATGTISLAGFYLRRSLRIFPLYYAVLGLYALLVLVLEPHTAAGAGFWRNLPGFLTYTSNWIVSETDSGRVIFYFAWSLACEEQFYALWPAAVRWLRGWLPAALMVGVLAALQVAPEAVRLAGPICLGSLAALAVHHRRGFALAWLLVGARWGAPAAAAAVVACVLLDAPLLVTGAAMTLLVVAVTIRPDHGLARPLEWRPARWVGEVSYGVYLLHMLVVNAARRVLPEHDGLVFLVSLVCVLAVAGLSRRFFEAPILRLKDRLGRAATAPSLPAAGSPAP